MERSPRMEYGRLLPSNLVTAVTVGHITNYHSLQLAIAKQDVLEVWEVGDTKLTKVGAAKLRCAVVDCSVLQAPVRHPKKQGFSPDLDSRIPWMDLDMLLLMDIQGRLSVIEWDGAAGLRESCQSLQVHKDIRGLFCKQSSSFFSHRLLLSRDSAAASCYGRGKGTSDHQNSGFELEGVTLVGFSHDTSTLHLLVVEWKSSAKVAQNDLTHHGKPKIYGGAAKMTVHLNLLQLSQSIPALVCIDTMAQTNTSMTLGLAFIGSVVKSSWNPNSVLDSRRHPLIVLLAAESGRPWDYSVMRDLQYLMELLCWHTNMDSGCSYQALSSQCFALDLSTSEIQQGPWKISNLHPTTTFVLPWYFDSKKATLLTDEAAVETGMQPGEGVLLVSSRSLLFVESTGRRSSVAICLQGLPTCYDTVNEQSLVIGDSSGALYIVDLSEWHNYSMQRIISDTLLSPARVIKYLQVSSGAVDVLNAKADCGNRNPLFFLSDFSGKSEIYILCSNTEVSPQCMSEGMPLNNASASDSPKEATYAEAAIEGTLPSGLCAKIWMEGRSSIKEPFCETISPVMDALFVQSCGLDRGQDLLVACGSAPIPMLRRGNVAVDFCLDFKWDVQITGLPLLFPFKIDWNSQADTHLLFSFPAKNTSHVMTLEACKATNVLIDAIDNGHCTLAIALLEGGSLLQVTEVALRVLRVSGWRVLKAEWTSPCTNRASATGKNHLTHAALAADGAVLARGHMLNAVQLDGAGGMPHTTATSCRSHQVSALSIFQDERNVTSVVILGLWLSNSVMVLSWPMLEDLSWIHIAGGPVRSVSGANFGEQHYICAGTADGFLFCHKLIRSIDSVEEETVEKLCAKRASTEQQDSNESSRSLNDGELKDKPLHHNERIKWLLQDGQKIKIGASEVQLEFCRACVFEVCSQQADCLLVQSDGLMVVVFYEGEDQTLRAVTVDGLSYGRGSSARTQVDGCCSTLVFLSSDGQLLFGHLDLHVALRWKSTSLAGSPQELAYHSASCCAVVSCTKETGASSLEIVHVPSMCQVIDFEIGTAFHPIVLKVVKLPCLRNQEVIWKEYILLVCERRQHSMGRLFLFDLSTCKPCKFQIPPRRHCTTTTMAFHVLACTKRLTRVEGPLCLPADGESQYELRLLGEQMIKLPCYSLCSLTLPEGFSFSTHHSLDEETQTPLMLHEDPSRALMKEAQNRALLALGGKGEVQLLSIFVVDSEISISLLAALSGAVDAALPSLEVLEDRYHEGESHCGTDEDTRKAEVWEVQESYIYPSKSQTCLMNLQRLGTFSTTGGGYVTLLTPGAGAVITVVEYLHGISIFEVNRQGKPIQLVWQPFSEPIEYLVPMSEEIYLVASHGMYLFQRNRATEAQWQQQEQQQNLEGEASNEIVVGNVPMETFRLPGLNQISTSQQLSSTCLKMLVGKLGSCFVPIISDAPPDCPGTWNAVLIISRNGEVGFLKVACPPK